MKFKVIEPKRRIDEKLAQSGKLEATTGIINSLAALGSALGIKTQALYTLTGMMGNIKSIWNDLKKLFDIKQKSYGLNGGDLRVAENFKKTISPQDFEEYIKSAFLYQEVKPEEPKPTSTETTGRTPEEEQKLFADLVANFKKQKGQTDESAKKAAKKLLQQFPSAKTIGDIK